MNHQSDAGMQLKSLPDMSTFEFKRARGTLFGLSGGRPSAHERVREKRPFCSSFSSKWAVNSVGPCTVDDGPWVCSHNKQPVVLAPHGIDTRRLRPVIQNSNPTPCGLAGKETAVEPAAAATLKPRAPATAMAIHLRAHAFAANPLRGVSTATTAVSPSAAAEALRSVLDPSSAANPL